MRITNLRVDMSQLPLTPSPPGPALAVQVFSSSGLAIPITNASQSSGPAQPALVFSVRTATDTVASALLPALSVTPDTASCGYRYSHHELSSPRSST